MPRILLADDSPHAQRMGERILTEEGYEVVTVSDGDSALIRLEDVDPDVVLADAIMPKRSGYEVCQFVKMSPRHRRTRVLVTIGAMESLDDEMVGRVQPDGVLKKPFEASVLLAAIKPLADAAASERSGSKAHPARPLAQPIAVESRPMVAIIDAEQVRAAVTIALDAAMAAMVDEITEKVLVALRTKTS
jgi:CheY-like chemotaxis protein